MLVAVWTRVSVIVRKTRIVDRLPGRAVSRPPPVGRLETFLGCGQTARRSGRRRAWRRPNDGRRAGRGSGAGDAFECGRLVLRGVCVPPAGGIHRTAGAPLAPLRRLRQRSFGPVGAAGSAGRAGGVEAHRALPGHAGCTAAAGAGSSQAGDPWRGQRGDQDIGIGAVTAGGWVRAGRGTRPGRRVQAGRPIRRVLATGAAGPSGRRPRRRR